MRRATAVLSAAVILVVGGCGGGGKSESATPSTAPTTGCTVAETEELYVTQKFTCDRGTRVYLFNTKSARDSWWQAAAEFGGQKVAEGDTWIEVKG